MNHDRPELQSILTGRKRPPPSDRRRDDACKRVRHNPPPRLGCGLADIRCAYRGAMFDDFCARERSAAAADARARYFVTSRVQAGGGAVAVEPPAETQAAPDELPGESLFARFEGLMVAGFGWKSSRFQKRFRGIILRTLAESVVGPDWARIGDRIMARRGWEACRKIGLAIASRRIGKSVTVSIGVLSYALTKPRSTQIVLATGARASKNVLEYVYLNLCKIGLAHTVVKCNQEELFLRNPDDPSDIRKMYSYPANARIRLLGHARPLLSSPLACVCACVCCHDVRADDVSQTCYLRYARRRHAARGSACDSCALLLQNMF